MVTIKIHRKFGLPTSRSYYESNLALLTRWAVLRGLITACLCLVAQAQTNLLPLAQAVAARTNYAVYLGTNDGYYARIGCTSNFATIALPKYGGYFLAVCSVSFNGTESDYSSEVFVRTSGSINLTWDALQAIPLTNVETYYWQDAGYAGGPFADIPNQPLFKLTNASGFRRFFRARVGTTNAP